LKAGTVVLWIPACIFIAAAAVFGAWMVSAHYLDEVYFAKACGNIMMMLSPLLIFLVAGRLKATRGVKHFGGGWSVLITTVVCTALVVLVGSIATMYRTFAFQIMPWEKYIYYLAISIGEETYYRLMLCWGILALLSCKNKALGILGAAATTALAFAAGSQASLDLRMAWILASIVAFAASYLVAGRKERNAPAWAVVVSVAISAATFSAAHWNVYKDYPEMLWATLIGGGIMASLLIVSKNPFVPFLAHFLLNLRSLQGIVIN
jgi:hypothetical protein